MAMTPISGGADGDVDASCALKERIKYIIKEHAGARHVEDASDLWADLKFEGDDVDHLFCEFQRQFAPLSTDQIWFEKHFELNEPPWFWDIWGRQRRRFVRDRIPITVRDIQTWIEAKQWPIKYEKPTL